MDKHLTSPVTPHWTGIVDSVLGMPTTGCGSRILFSGVGDTALRANMTTRVSEDGGYTWSKATTLWAGPAAYSDLAAVGQNSAIIIFENGDRTFADRVSTMLLEM